MDFFINFFANAKRPDNTVIDVKDKETVLVIDTNLQVWLIKSMRLKGETVLAACISDK